MRDLLSEGEHFDESWSNAFGMVLTDAVLTQDVSALAAAGEEVYLALDRLGSGNPIARGRLLSYLDIARWGQKRLEFAQASLKVTRNVAAHRFLWALRRSAGLTNSDLVDQGVGGEEWVSRVGRELRDDGLVVVARSGRNKIWELTPQGERVVDELGPPGAPPRAIRRDSPVNGHGAFVSTASEDYESPTSLPDTARRRASAR
jgi:hypothetical protein